VNPRIREYRTLYTLPLALFVIAGVLMLIDAPTRPDPDLPFLAAGTAFFGVVTLLVSLDDHRKARRHGRLLATGDRGTARIRSLTLRGRASRGGLRYRLELLVRTEAHGEYELTRSTTPCGTTGT
jgi:hypothetical protein